jgi:hypothetical protein
MHNVDMKKNQKGFSIFEGLLLIIIVGMIGGVGYFVYNSQKNTNISLDNADKASTAGTVKTSTPRQSTTNSSPYTFEQLGVSMDVLSGWEVKSNPSKSEGVNFYSWTVHKNGADGEIVLSSVGFRGGYEECGPTQAVIKEVAPTQNNNLMFMSWSYKNSGETTNNVGIVKSDNSEFSIKGGTDESLTDPIKNRDTKAGNYTFCLGYPTPGFSLELNKEATPGFSRKDSITALSNLSSDKKYVRLTSTAQSYPDIKAMLVTIK